MSDITEFKDMNPKRYPLHHDHGTVTISRDVFETMSKELERLRQRLHLHLHDPEKDRKDGKSAEDAARSLFGSRFGEFFWTGVEVKC